MDRRLIPKNIYIRKMKENLTSKSNSLIESVQNEILEKWSELELNSESESVFLYEEDHHSISASAIEIHKDNIFWINPTSKKNKISLKFGSSKYHIRVPMNFLDLEISINQLEKLDNQIKIVSTKKERQILSDIKSGCTSECRFLSFMYFALPERST